MNIGNRVRQLRQAKNMKIADLAEAIGVDAANISRLETGKQKQFTEQTLSNIAKSLGVDILPSKVILYIKTVIMRMLRR